MHLENLYFATQFCMAISDTHNRKRLLRDKKYLLDVQKRRTRASSTSVIWYIVSFGQKDTDRPFVTEGGIGMAAANC